MTSSMFPNMIAPYIPLIRPPPLPVMQTALTYVQKFVFSTNLDWKLRTPYLLVVLYTFKQIAVEWLIFVFLRGKNVILTFKKTWHYLIFTPVTDTWWFYRAGYNIVGIIIYSSLHSIITNIHCTYPYRIRRVLSVSIIKLSVSHSPFRDIDSA